MAGVANLVVAANMVAVVVGKLLEVLKVAMMDTVVGMATLMVVVILAGVANMVAVVAGKLLGVLKVAMGMDMDMVMDLEVMGQIMHCLKLETTGTRVGPSSPLASKLRNGTPKRRFRNCVSQREMFRNFEHVWNSGIYI